MSNAAKATPPAKSTTPPTGTAPPAKNSKKMFIVILGVLLLSGGSALAYLLLKPAHPAKPGEVTEEAHPEVAPKFVELGTFTANLIHEEGDRYLQVAIALKLSKPELEEKIKLSKPELMHRVNMLLQSKRPSELASITGKEKLATDIKAQVEFVMGLRKISPAIGVPQPELSAQATPEPLSETGAPHSTPVTIASNSGIADVLFTSFIVQ